MSYYQYKCKYLERDIEYKNNEIEKLKQKIVLSEKSWTKCTKYDEGLKVNETLKLNIQYAETMWYIC